MTQYKLRDWIDINKLNWEGLSRNPEIFEINYKYLEERMNIIKNELYEVVLNPQFNGKL